MKSNEEIKSAFLDELDDVGRRVAAFDQDLYAFGQTFSKKYLPA